MKNIVYRLTLIIGLLAAPLALSAKSPEETYLAQYRGRTDMPVPVKIVTPNVEGKFAGRKVQVEFNLDAAGVPQNITTTTPAPAQLVAELSEAVAQWRFEPRALNGKATSTRVILPLTIVDSEG